MHRAAMGPTQLASTQTRSLLPFLLGLGGHARLPALNAPFYSSHRHPRNHASLLGAHDSDSIVCTASPACCQLTLANELHARGRTGTQSSGGQRGQGRGEGRGREERRARLGCGKSCHRSGG